MVGTSVAIVYLGSMAQEVLLARVTLQSDFTELTRVTLKGWWGHTVPCMLKRVTLQRNFTGLTRVT